MSVEICIKYIPIPVVFDILGVVAYDTWQLEEICVPNVAFKLLSTKYLSCTIFRGIRHTHQINRSNMFEQRSVTCYNNYNNAPGTVRYHLVTVRVQTLARGVFHAVSAPCTSNSLGTSSCTAAHSHMCFGSSADDVVPRYFAAPCSRPLSHVQIYNYNHVTS